MNLDISSCHHDTSEFSHHVHSKSNYLIISQCEFGYFPARSSCQRIHDGGARGGARGLMTSELTYVINANFHRKLTSTNPESSYVNILYVTILQKTIMN